MADRSSTFSKLQETTQGNNTKESQTVKGCALSKHLGAWAFLAFSNERTHTILFSLLKDTAGSFKAGTGSQSLLRCNEKYTSGGTLVYSVLRLFQRSFKCKDVSWGEEEFT